METNDKRLDELEARLSKLEYSLSVIDDEIKILMNKSDSECTYEEAKKLYDRIRGIYHDFGVSFYRRYKDENGSIVTDEPTTKDAYGLINVEKKTLHIFPKKFYNRFGFDDSSIFKIKKICKVKMDSKISIEGIKIYTREIQLLDV